MVLNLVTHITYLLDLLSTFAYNAAGQALMDK